MSQSQHQKWNSTTDEVDPWSVTSHNVHSRVKKSSGSKQDVLFNNITIWSENWNTPVENKNKKKNNSFKTKQTSQLSETSHSFFEILPGQNWEFDEPNDKKDFLLIEEELGHQSRYKTELCRSWTDTGICRYGSKCQFAHGREELRPVLRHPKYKTELCRSWSETGRCPYGSRCRFIHNESVSLSRHQIHEDDDELSLLGSFNDFNLKDSEESSVNSSKDEETLSESDDQEDAETGIDTTEKGTRLPFFKRLCL